MKPKPHDYSLLVVTAPSGSGKTTIVRHILEIFDFFRFSVSATTRKRRKGEVDGQDYYFITQDDFQGRIDQGLFVEWEEVYQGQLYGTLTSEVDRIRDQGHVVVFDIEVNGARNIKAKYGDQALCLFIAPPGIDELENRLVGRGTEDETAIKSRLDRARKEIKELDRFDLVLVNDELKPSLDKAEVLIREYFANRLK